MIKRKGEGCFLLQKTLFERKMENNSELKSAMLDTIQSMIDDGILSRSELIRFSGEEDEYNPEYIRFKMEKWYKDLGIEDILGRKFELQLPYFTEEEIKKAYDDGEIVLCVPKGVTKKQLAKMFNFETWALDDELITDTTEVEDFWFTTKATLLPDNMDKPGREIQRLIQKEGRLGMSLERYMVFIARMRYLTGNTPDIKNKVWLTHGRYEGKAMLIAGFDSKRKLSVHGWMPNFQSPMVGSRSIYIADHV